MPLLSRKEASSATDAFLCCIYGDDVFTRWQEMKMRYKFNTERDYVSWLMDVANSFEENEQYLGVDETSRCHEFVDEKVASIFTPNDTKEGYDASLIGQSMDEETERVVKTERPQSAQEDRAASISGSGGQSSSTMSVQNGVNARISGGHGHSNTATSKQSVSTFKSITDLFKHGDRVFPSIEELDTSQPSTAAEQESIKNEPFISGNAEEDSVGGYYDATDITFSSDNEDINDNVDTISGDLPAVATGHSLAEDSNSRLHQCPHCSKMAKTRRLIEHHINEVHLRIRPYICPHCAHAFSRNSNLKRHVLSRHKQVA